MTPIELGALIAGYLLAAARLFNAARFAWAWLPTWAQLCLPAVVAALPQLAGALGMVETRMDIVEAILLSVGTVVAATRGKPAAAAVLLLVLTFTPTACASYKPVLRDVNDVASFLCATAPGVKARAQREGLSVGQLCALKHVLDPFIDEALRAQKAGARRAGIDAARE